MVESRLAASLEHPNIVPIHAAGEANGVLYLAMRFIEGTDLRGLLRQESPLAPARAAELVAQIGRALDAARSRGLVHPDVKPANVLVSTVAGSEHFYLSAGAEEDERLSEAARRADEQDDWENEGWRARPEPRKTTEQGDENPVPKLGNLKKDSEPERK